MQHQDKREGYRDKLRSILIVRVLDLGRTDFQQRLAASLLHWFFAFQNKIVKIGFWLTHVITVIIAYWTSGWVETVLTALLPGISQAYWLYYLYTTGSNLVGPFLALLIIGPLLVFLLFNKERTSVAPRLGQR